MLVWSLVLSLATVLQTAQAYPNPSRPQYGSLGKHGGGGHRGESIQPAITHDDLMSIGGGMFGDWSRYAYPRWRRGRCCESTDYGTLGVW